MYVAINLQALGILSQQHMSLIEHISSIEEHGALDTTVRMEAAKLVDMHVFKNH